MYLLKFFVAIPLLFADGDKTQTSQAHTEVRLISENESFKAGATNQVGLLFKHEPQWHTYWLNPGDSASAPIFRWQAPPGVVVSAPRFPVPERIENDPLVSFGYSGDSLIIFDVEVPETQAGPISLSLEAEWVACKVECVPGQFTFSRTWPISEAPSASIEATRFSPDHGRFPRIAAEMKMDELHFELKFPLAKDLQFFDAIPFPGVPVSNQLPKRTFHDDEKMLLQVDRDLNSPHQNAPLKYLLVARDQEGQKRGFIVEAEPSKEILWFMALLAFLGGILLNFMPCVFPVLSLKIFAVAQSSAEAQTAIRKSHGFYVLGVLVSFWLMALALLLLQKGGAAVGWGFQMQSPVFVGFLLALFIVMGLYFLDLIPLSLGQFSQFGQSLTQKQGGWGSFFTGVLAVLVASPCTAPFMGAAMGYALSRSAIEVFLIFTGLGLGLASPFIALILWPDSLQGLPRPGRWMVLLKKSMALPMFLTAAWLGWVLSLQTGLHEPSPSELWQKFSPAKLFEMQGDNRGVFINFTAAWCISCQVNERLVFQDQDIVRAVKEKNLVMLKADWTNRDAEIGAILKTYGRAGVPLYLFFAPGRSQPIILPEILTPGIFTNTVLDEI